MIRWPEACARSVPTPAFHVLLAFRAATLFFRVSGVDALCCVHIGGGDHTETQKHSCTSAEQQMASYGDIKDPLSLVNKTGEVISPYVALQA